MRKTLPKDFDDRLQTASPEDMQAIFGECLIDARGGHSKQTAVGFVDCPDELIVWLVAQGLDADAVDAYGATPLWMRASLGRAEQIPLLLSLGADIEYERGNAGTPLHAAAGRQKPGTTRVLIEQGANLNAVNSSGETPLLHGLRQTTNATIREMAQVAQALIGAGAVVADEMRAC